MMIRRQDPSVGGSIVESQTLMNHIIWNPKKNDFWL